MNYDKKKALLFGFLKGLQAEFFGIFVMLFFWAVAKAFGKAANVMFGFTGVMCVVCVMADYCLKQGNIAQNKVKLHGDKVSKNFGGKIGLAAMLPSLISLALLVLSKIGAIGNFLPAFKIINAPYFPLFDFVAHTADIKAMAYGAFIMAAFFPAIYWLSSFIAFRIGYSQVDVKEKVMYK